jgi:5-methylcytosine-specific restriction protein A
MPRALKVCSTPRCPELVTAGRCDTCRGQAEQQRGTRQQRGYGRQHETRFRPGVLRRDPLCVCEEQDHGHSAPCLAPSTVADHWPIDKRELRRLKLDEHDPARGRGLCKACHDKHTARTQPGGWHARHTQ